MHLVFSTVHLKMNFDLNVQYWHEESLLENGPQDFEVDDFVDSPSTPTAAALRVKQFDVAGSVYARWIKDEEWEHFHDVIDRLEASVGSRQEVLRVLHADYQFFPTYRQLNAKMKQWKCSRVTEELSRVQAPKAGRALGLLRSQTSFANTKLLIESMNDPSFVEWSMSDDLDASIHIPMSTSSGRHGVNPLEMEVDPIFPAATSGKQREPPEVSEADTMSTCSSGSADFRHFRRYAEDLRDKPAAMCYTSRALRSSGSSHSSWGFEQVTGFPAAYSTPGSNSQSPFRRIRSGVVFEAKPAVTVAHPSRKPRPVVIHQYSTPSDDIPRSLDMAGSRWR